MKSQNISVPTTLCYSFVLFIFSLSLFIRCGNKEEKLIGSYEGDKFVPIDTSAKTKAEMKHSDQWVISLQEENVFQFTGRNKKITGTWQIMRRTGDDYTLLFKFDRKSFTGRLNENIIYFDKPKKNFDDLVAHIIFVRTTKH